MKQTSAFSIHYEHQRRFSTLLKDIKALFKGLVLVSNVLPVLAGLTSALYVTDKSIVDALSLVIMTLIGTTFVIAGALAINNWYDADIDAVMKRTRHRPTVTGSFSLSAVLTIGLIISVVGFVILGFTTLLTLLFAVIGWIVYVLLYTVWSKRTYTWNTIIGSISGAVTPLIGWFAVTTTFSWLLVAMVVILFLWQMPHTYAIAIKKYQDYQIAKVKMLPVTHGVYIAKKHTLYYLISLVPSSLFFYPLGIGYTIFTIILASLGCIIASLGFNKANDSWNWAHRVFLFTVNYIMVLFLSIVIITSIFY